MARHRSAHGSDVDRLAFAVPSIIAFVVKLIWPNKPLLVKGRTVAFILITMIMTTGILVECGLQGNWGRPRPSDVTEFRGPWQFKNWWDASGECPEELLVLFGRSHHCVLGPTPRHIGPAQWRPFAYAGATGLALLTGFAAHQLRPAFPEKNEQFLRTLAPLRIPPVSLNCHGPRNLGDIRWPRPGPNSP